MPAAETAPASAGMVPVPAATGPAMAEPATAPVGTTPAPGAVREALALSALAGDSAVMPNAVFERWFAERQAREGFTVRRIPLEAMDGWHFAPDTGDLRHDSGHFFAVEGLRVRTGDGGPGACWEQPVISQREIGVLGFLVAEFDGVWHFLVQAKTEPGNVNTVHLAPTVQATRSNLMGVHQGRGPHHAEHFVAPSAGRVLVDSLQSERGSWFLRKRNRHMVVVADPRDVAGHEDFCWLTLGQIRRLLGRDNLVSMEASSVLACLSYEVDEAAARDGYGAALLRSLAPAAPTVHSTPALVSAVNEIKARTRVEQQSIPLAEVGGGWRRADGALGRSDGRYFGITGAEVWAASREVGHWAQPLLVPAPGGVCALLTRAVDGVLHVLLHARSEAGLLDVVELCPTVQCTPSNHRHLPERQRPRFLREVLGAPPARVRYDVMVSEEGARFDRAENRYLVVEAPDDLGDVPDDYVWVSLAQAGELLGRGYFLNMQARTLLAALHAVW
ncbi:NDP-hexose 2,3-dehydratase family protein [Streptomyces sp. NPDC047028]|uniref:NDP-hexose 2,3-dehydratase family protein n=1 Tax=Streptomyces sp. NPDC047028 TaxID=3155793 RepID=UPI0033F45D1F